LFNDLEDLLVDIVALLFKAGEDGGWALEAGASAGLSRFELPFDLLDFEFPELAVIPFLGGPFPMYMYIIIYFCV
jgi:hypothetical protein